VTPSEVGYSGTPLAKKLGVKEGSTLVLVAAPAHWAVAGLPPEVHVHRRRALRAGDRAEVVVAFFTQAARFAAARPRHRPAAGHRLGTVDRLAQAAAGTRAT
jgi:hypothetical protein